MRPRVVFVESFVNPSFVAQFRDLIAANAKTSLKREIGCKRFDVLVDPEESRRFISYEICEKEAAFDDRLAPSHCVSFCKEMATNDNISRRRRTRRTPH